MEILDKNEADFCKIIPQPFSLAHLSDISEQQRSIEVLLLVGGNRNIALGIRNTGEHKASRKLLVAKEGLIGLVDCS